MGFLFSMGKGSPVKVRAYTLSGQEFTCETSYNQSIRDVRKSISDMSSIPAREIRLAAGTKVWCDKDKLSDVIAADCAEVTVALTRRFEEQSLWVEQVQADPGCLAKAPRQILSDFEVVLEAMKGDTSMLWFASWDLCTNSQFVEAARVLLGWPADASFDRLSVSKLIHTAVDAKLALILAPTEQLPGVVQTVLASSVIQRAYKAEQAALVVPLARVLKTLGNPITLGNVSLILNKFTRENLLRTMVKDVLPNLTVCLELLNLHHRADNDGLLGKWFGFNSISWACEFFESASDFALAVFSEHREYFSIVDGKLSEAARKDFRALCVYLQDTAPSDTEISIALVNAGLGAETIDFVEGIFGRVASDSEPFLNMLKTGRLPLTVLVRSPIRAKLLTAVLDEFESDEAILEAIQNNHNELGRLVQRVEGIGRLGRLQKVLETSCKSEHAAGPALLRCYVTGNPIGFPSFPVPTSWIGELANVNACSSVATSKFLAQLLRLDDDAVLKNHVVDTWHLFRWREATAQQVDDAVRVVRRWGRDVNIEIASLDGQRAEERRMALHGDLNRALAALPLLRMSEPSLIVSPDLPPQAAMLFANERIHQLQEENRRLTEESRKMRKDLANYQDRLGRLESTVSSVKNTVQTLTRSQN